MVHLSYVYGQENWRVNHFTSSWQVVFPDLSCHWFIPKRDDLHDLSPNKQRLSTTVILSHTGWSGKSSFLLSIPLLIFPHSRSFMRYCCLLTRTNFSCWAVRTHGAVEFVKGGSDICVFKFSYVNCYATLSCAAVYYAVQGSFDSNTKSLASIFLVILCSAFFGGGGGGWEEGGQGQVVRCLSPVTFCEWTTNGRFYITNGYFINQLHMKRGLRSSSSQFV